MDDLLHLASQLADQSSAPLFAPIRGRIAYVVSHGQSYASNGYAIRTQGIAQALNQHGFETLCFVRPGRPWELAGWQGHVAPESLVNGVRYIHSRWPGGKRPDDELDRLKANAARFEELFRVYRPETVLAASNYRVGLPAWIAAKRLGLPFYNEVRGFWELSRDAREPGYAHSSAGKQETARDSFVARQAHRVFTLNRPMQEELGRRGVEQGKIDIVPNGVSELPKIKPADPTLKQTLAIQEDDKVVGYVGSFGAYEGLDLLLEACNDLVEKGENLKLLLVGDNQSVAEATGVAKVLADQPWLIQVGRVPHEQVADYYALIDLVVIPRKSLPVCELVPPMKVAEALAYGKRLVVSNVAPLAEYAQQHGSVVSFEAGNTASLAQALLKSLKATAPVQRSKRTLSDTLRSFANTLSGDNSEPVANTGPLKRFRNQPTLSVEGEGYSESFNNILSEAAEIPDSNGSEYFTKHDFRVGVIGDVYMYNFYKDVFATVHYLSPDNYIEVLEKGIDLVIYTTCWKGVNNEEWRGVKFREKPKKALNAILDHAKENNIKTVFQTIEDPSNFDYFLPVAKKFDYILTTDTDCIERYKKELGHNRVFFGEYGVNPQFNNPIGCRRNIRNAAFFAGSYPTRYKERCEDMEIVFDSIIDAGGELLIADRNFGDKSEDLAYPARFQSSVLPPVQHALLQKLHKLFRYNLNFNSIKQSPTMCAMRVYELQAQGNGLISNYANSVFNRFPGIRIVPFKQDMSFDFGRDETWEEYRINVSNIREVLDSKTSYQVVSKLLENIGLRSMAKKNTTIAVICVEKTAAVLQSFEAQVYPHKILIEESELVNWEKIKKQHNVGYFCWFSSANSYEKYYLNDLLNGFKYTDCFYITKNAFFDAMGRYVVGKEHEYTDLCSGKALTLFSAQHLEPAQLSPYSEQQSFSHENGYSIDPFEVNFISYMKQHARQVTDYQLSVIVPVYNNGRFLISKCMPSLQRNKLWEKMEILLVDDGSTDQETLRTLDYLNEIYPNVRVKFNHDGGSGSASRPRNQGIDIATAPLITFLDPDNEIAPGAYDLLTGLYSEANQLSDEPVEFISGFHVKVGEDVRTIGKHTPNRLSIINNFKKAYFDRGRFPVIATQSAVIFKDYLDSNNIRFVERSAGQDTLFGWELIARAKCGGFNGDAYIIYYSDRNDSITNKIDKSYFEKKLILEIKQKEFLEENGIIGTYLEKHFSNFMNNWYLKKLENVVECDRNASVEILKEICELYGESLENYMSKTSLHI
jgi:glycosyltransferase involved in cell wall biosynthesis